MISQIPRKPVHFTNTSMFLLHSNGILEMLRIENYSLFFVPAHTVTLIKNYFNYDYSPSLSEN